MDIIQRVRRAARSSNSADVAHSKNAVLKGRTALAPQENSQKINGLCDKGRSTATGVEKKVSAPIVSKLNCPQRAKTSRRCSERSDSLIVRRPTVIPYPDVAGIERELQCIEFTDDVKKYLRYYEKKFVIKEGFLAEKAVTGKMRSILLDWVVQVHDRLNLLPETLFLTAYIIDAYLMKEVIEKAELQLLGVTALFIAGKFEEMYNPDIHEYEFICDGVFTRGQIFRLEQKVLQAVGFLLSRPAPITFLRFINKHLKLSEKTHNCARYFLEVGVQNYQTSHYRPSHLAIVATYLAAKMCGDSVDVAALLEDSEMTEEELVTRNAHLSCAVILNQQNNKLKGIRTKYSSGKFNYAGTVSAEHTEWLKTQYDLA